MTTDIEMSIKSLVAESLLAADQKNKVLLATIFVDDAELQQTDPSGNVASTRGRNAILTVLCGIDDGRIQFVPSIDVYIDGSDRAHATYTVFHVVRGANPLPPTASECIDELRVNDGVWCIVRREVKPLRADVMACLDALAV